jgi:hypothetical protein
MQTLALQLVSTLYGTPSTVAEFEKRHPDERVLVACPCKALRSRAAPTPPRRSLSWLGARRANLILSTRRLQCGSWEVPCDTVVDAELLTFGTTGLQRGHLLRISTRDALHYQFGVQDDPAWAGELPFPVRRGSTTLRRSPMCTAMYLLAGLLPGVGCLALVGLFIIGLVGLAVLGPFLSMLSRM